MKSYTRYLRVNTEEERDIINITNQVQETINNSEIKIDSRPSDAIALAIKTFAPIFTTNKVIENASFKSIVLESGTTTPATQETEFTKFKTLDNLKDALGKAIEDEEYEIAAKLRDKIAHLED